MKILAIESSCDETAAAVINSGQGLVDSGQSESTVILSNVVASQIDIHKKYGGVFPEVASRAHTEKIIEVIEQALIDSGQGLVVSDQGLGKKNHYPLSTIPSTLINNIDLIAVTTGPGLIGSLLVGVNAAKTLAYTCNKPIIGINHWLGHIYSAFGGEISKSEFLISNNENINSSNSIIDNLPKFPILALIVSGGHTGLVLMKSHTEYETIGETLDDAVGEAFDKVANILGLGYPGGPAIAAAAEKVNSDQGLGVSIKFPRSMLDRPDFNFSFSGLKTAVLYKVKELTNHYSLTTIAPVVAYEFQQAAIDILIGKTLKAAEKYQPKSIVLCGGVSANKELRSQMEKAVLSFRTSSQQDLESRSPISFHLPPLNLTGDNAAMIGIAAAYQVANGVKPTTYDQIEADSNSKL